MDRYRFHNRMLELRKLAVSFSTIAKMPDRAQATDFSEAANLMSRAADDLEEVIKAELPGCICKRIKDDTYDYLDYALNCRHHGELYRQIEALKQRYEKAEKTLKDEMRMSLVRAALTGTSDMPTTLTVEGIAIRSIEIADATLHQLMKADK